MLSGTNIQPLKSFCNRNFVAKVKKMLNCRKDGKKASLPKIRNEKRFIEGSKGAVFRAFCIFFGVIPWNGVEKSGMYAILIAFDRSLP